jgi:hypothetical protein
MAAGLKIAMGLHPIVGSNPTPSARSRIALSDKAILASSVGTAAISMVCIAAVSLTPSATRGLRSIVSVRAWLDQRIGEGAGFSF